MTAQPTPAPGHSDELAEGLRQLLIPQSERALRLLGLYMDEIERWSPRFGLVKVASRQELIVKHVLDSLSAWMSIRDAGQDGSVLDVGSGAGLPGIPLAISLPRVSFTLLERSAKRVSFLRACKALVGLENVTVVQGDLEAVDLAFDVVTFRAVSPLSRFLTDAKRCELRFRAVVAYKGRIDRAQAEIEDVRRLTGDLYCMEVVPVKVPFLDETRCIILLRT